MKISQFMAKQYANPSGLFGRVVIAMLLNKANRASNKAVYSALELESGNCFLEVGFGGAELLFEVVRRAECKEVCGIEKSGQMLQRARSLFHRKGILQAVKLIPGDISDLPIPDSEFDRVCSVNTVYFWSDLHLCASELARVTADNGRVVLGYGSGEKLTESGYTKGGFQFHHPEDINRAMKNAGLQLQNNRRLERAGKDPFFVVVYSRDTRKPHA